MQPVIMFDFDGVVADSFEVFFGEFTAACAEMGYDKLNSHEAFLRLFDGNLIEQLVRAGFPVWRLKKLVRTFEPRIKEANRRVKPFAGMPEVLGALAARFPVYVITSNVSETVLNFLSAYAIENVRDVIGAEKETSKVKKIKRVRKLHSGYTPYYIGDTKGDMIEGRAAGAVTVAAAWGWHPEPRLREAAPDHLFRTPAELRGLFLPEG